MNTKVTLYDFDDFLEVCKRISKNYVAEHFNTKSPKDSINKLYRKNNLDMYVVVYGDSFTSRYYEFVYQVHSTTLQFSVYKQENLIYNYDVSSENLKAGKLDYSTTFLGTSLERGPKGSTDIGKPVYTRTELTDSKGNTFERYFPSFPSSDKENKGTDKDTKGTKNKGSEDNKD